MFYTKEQLAEKISDISRQRYQLDHTYASLQRLVSNVASDQARKKSIVIIRQQFNSLVAELSSIIIDKCKQLKTLEYRCEKLVQNKQNMTTQLQSINSLNQYFQDLKNRLSSQKKKGEEAISTRQKWEIIPQFQDVNQQEKSLINSTQVARQALQYSSQGIGMLKDQQNRLSNAQNIMGNALKNINFAGNITTMIRTRSRQDNKLIVLLTIGLIIEIFLCLFYIKPMIRGQQ